LYLTLSLARWHRMSTPSWDNAIFEEAIKGYAHLSLPVVDIKGEGFVQLGDHFSPLLAVIAPFYAIWPSGVTLLVAQCVALGLSILPLTLAARRHLGPVPGAAIGLAYGLSWGLQSGVDVQFHEYCLAVPLLAFALAALLDARWRAAAVWSALLLGVKEDLGLTVAVIGLVMWVEGWRRERRRLGAPGRVGDYSGADARRELRTGRNLVIAGSVTLVVVLLIIIPAFNPGHHWDYWGRLEGDGGSMTGEGGIAAALGNLPELALNFFQPYQKVNTLVLVVALTVGAACVSPYGLIAVPTLVWRFISPNYGFWGSGWHYSLVLMPIVFGAGIDALRRLKTSESRAVRRYAAAVPSLALAFALVAASQFPFRDLVKPETYDPPGRADQVAAVMDLIDDDCTIGTDVGLIVYLPSRCRVFWVADLPAEPLDYLVFDPTSGWSGDPGNPVDWAQSTYPDATYELVYGEAQSGDPEGLRLAKRVG
jgi:hypothetical protein